MAAKGTVTSGSETLPFTGKITIQGMQLDPALNALATTQVSISGTAGANLSVQGRGFSMPDLTTSLEGTGHIALKDGKIKASICFRKPSRSSTSPVSHSIDAEGHGIRRSRPILS